jgi:antitoxin component YwqK of YwqJK toxin-antitoxin module
MWKNGKKDGLGKIINDKGQTLSKGIYKEGVLDK